MGCIQSKKKVIEKNTQLDSIINKTEGIVNENKDNIVSNVSEQVKVAIKEELTEKLSTVIQLKETITQKVFKTDELDMNSNVLAENDLRISYYIMSNTTKQGESDKNLINKIENTIDCLKNVGNKVKSAIESKEFDLEDGKDIIKNLQNADIVIPSEIDVNFGKKSVKDLIQKYNSSKKSPRNQTLRHKTSNIEKEERMNVLNNEIKNREKPYTLKEQIETMEEVFTKCETIRDF